ncbi:uncharacterized protein LOC129606159 isoform X2 [Condylostylus longicornis]|uniref:uncharacterized protein LOC129606159 isoform X2 n=1 Tax=Condylostylus longicornis TaxID=2530218 RepID=UPI00244DE03F|nr:uncharacterized protein LOC129606159 isoform X2 [Condylostylus longicornis]XP_055372294.1 uncharacterized protein LOC129606159 isoform X2 [Condylostylus longicornis]
MKMFPSHYIELYCNKNLVVDYQLEKVPLKILGQYINLNNWLTFKDWLEVYDKLHTILYKKHNEPNDEPLTNFTRENYLICNNRIKIEIVKENFVKNFAEIFQVEVEYFHSFVVRIYISLENQIKVGSNSSLLKNQNKVQSGFKATKKLDLSYEPYNPIKNKLKDEIVDMEFVKYTPSQISQEEPYTPQLLFNKAESISPDLLSPQKSLKKLEKYPVYKASPISSGENDDNSEVSDNQKCQYTQKKRKRFDDPKKHEEHRETRSHKRSGLRSIFENKEKNYVISNNPNKTIKFIGAEVLSCKEKELFGSDDSELELESKVRKPSKPVKHKIGISSKKKCWQEDKVMAFNKKNGAKLSNECLSSLNVMENWLSTNKFQQCDFKETKAKYSLLGRGIIESAISESLLISAEERILKRETHTRDIQAIKQLNNVIKNVVKTQKAIETKTLNHLSVDNVLSTFPKYKIMLDKHFDNFKLRPQRDIPKIENLDYMALQNFVPAKHLLAMCTYLREMYESEKGVPQFTELYMLLLVPEWVLAIFMEEYKMDRQQALQQIVDQEEINFPTQIS